MPLLHHPEYDPDHDNGLEAEPSHSLWETRGDVLRGSTAPSTTHRHPPMIQIYDLDLDCFLGETQDEGAIQEELILGWVLAPSRRQRQLMRQVLGMEIIIEESGLEDHHCDDDSSFDDTVSMMGTNRNDVPDGRRDVALVASDPAENVPLAEIECDSESLAHLARSGGSEPRNWLDRCTAAAAEHEPLETHPDQDSGRYSMNPLEQPLLSVPPAEVFGTKS